jgi:UDP-N-acetylmuramate-alanine ligase
MIAALLSYPGLDPTVVVGGRVGTMGGSNARVGKSDYLVVESDESDGSFLKLAPIVVVITNIDREHLDYYPGLGEIRRAFAEFAGKIPFYGAAILCLDDENVQQILPCCEPPHDHVRRERAGRSAHHALLHRPHVERVSSALPRAGSGLLPLVRARRAQRAECDRRDRRGARA